MAEPITWTLRLVPCRHEAPTRVQDDGLPHLYVHWEPGRLPICSTCEARICGFEVLARPAAGAPDG